MRPGLAGTKSFPPPPNVRKPTCGHWTQNRVHAAWCTAKNKEPSKRPPPQQKGKLKMAPDGLEKASRSCSSLARPLPSLLIERLWMAANSSPSPASSSSSNSQSPREGTDGGGTCSGARAAKGTRTCAAVPCITLASLPLSQQARRRGAHALGYPEASAATAGLELGLGSSHTALDSARPAERFPMAL